MKTNFPTCLALDIGGVFHGDSWETIFTTELASFYGIDISTVQSWGGLIWDAHAHGPSSERAYWHDWEIRLGRPVDLAYVHRLIERDVWVDQSVADVMSYCDARHIPVCIVSNNTGFWYKHEMTRAGLATYLPTLQTFLSCDTGLPKAHPHGGLSLLAAAHDPGTTLFVDDRAENIEAAERLGIKGLLYTRRPEVSLAEWLLPQLAA